MSKEQWISDKQRIVLKANQLEEMYNSEAFQVILDGMIKTKISQSEIIDNESSTEAQIKEAISKRRTINWFVDSIIYNIYEGDRARKVLEDFMEKERKIEEKKAKRKGDRQS